MSSEQETEEVRSRRWFGGLSTWFRNLSGPKKAVATAVTVAGGAGAILGAINGAITLAETISDAGREVKSEKPIRADYQYYNGPMDGVLPIELDPGVNPSDYLPLTAPSEAQSTLKDKVGFTDPTAWIEVTSQVKDETVSLAPYLVLNLTTVTPMPETVNYAVYQPGGGGGGEIDYFIATLSPERGGVFYAPQWTADTALGSYTPTPVMRKTDDFFTLAPSSETEFFQLDFVMLPGYYYRFRIGVLYSYHGRRGVVWSEQFVAGVPREATVWLQTANGARFEKYGDLRSFERYLNQQDSPLLRPLSRHDKGEIEKVIQRQEAAVQKYGYPYTPPEQLN
jgi:hypothetical protein